MSDPGDPSDHLCHHLYHDFGIWCSNGVSYSSRPSIDALYSIDAFYVRFYLEDIKKLRLISTTVYRLACKFDAVADLKELQIRKSSVLPNDRIKTRFELQVGYILEPPD